MLDEGNPKVWTGCCTFIKLKLYVLFVGAGTAAGAAAAGAAMMAAGTGMMMMNPTMMLFPMILAGASFAKVLLLYILHLKIA